MKKHENGGSVDYSTMKLTSNIDKTWESQADMQKDLIQLLQAQYEANGPEILRDWQETIEIIQIKLNILKNTDPNYYAKGGETKQTVAVYDMDKFLQSQLDYFIDNPKEFEDRADYLLEDEYERELYEKDKEEYIKNWFYSSESESYDWYWDDVKMELDTEFDKYIDDRVFVKGSNMGWRNREGTKTFVLEDTEQMLRELVPENTDFTYYLYKIKDGEYEARVSHHDSPMGEYFEIKIEPNYINRIYLENNDGERIGLIYVDSSELGKVEKLEDHEFENFSHWKDEDEDDEGNYVVLQYDFEDTKKNINKNFDEFVKHFPNSTLTEDIKEINY